MTASPVDGAAAADSRHISVGGGRGEGEKLAGPTTAGRTGRAAELTEYAYPEPAEHARYAEYLRALAAVPPAGEPALIRRVLTDPDRPMADAAVIRHMDRKGQSLYGAPPETWQEWAAGVREALGPTPSPFLLTRLREWTHLHTLTTSHTWDPAQLSTASDWLQRRLTETPDVPVAVLAHLAEHGRTRRVRAAAGRRLG